MTYTWDTPFHEWVEDMAELKPCPIALEWCRQVARERVSFGEALERFIRDPQARQQAWSYWVLQNYYGQLDDRLREGFARQVKDPMMALRAFRQLGLSAETDKRNALYECFAGKLPVAEQELRESRDAVD